MQGTIWIVSVECRLTRMITAGADPEAAQSITFAIIQASTHRVGKLNSMDDLYFAGWQMQPSQSITQGNQQTISSRQGNGTDHIAGIKVAILSSGRIELVNPVIVDIHPEQFLAYCLPNWTFTEAGSCSKNNAQKRSHAICPQEVVHL
jgi:hypothetical protein